LFDRLPLTFLVAIEIAITHTPHVIPTFGLDGLEPGTSLEQNADADAALNDAMKRLR